MGMPIDLETLREIFKDTRQHVAIGQILRLSIPEDRSVVNAFVSVWPEQREVIAKMTWEAVGPDAGIFMLPVAGDLVLLAWADGDDDTINVIKRFTSREDKIPVNALTGDIVLKANSGKRGWFTALKIFLTKGDAEPTENLVLGQQLKTLLSYLLLKLKDQATEISTHHHIGNLGYPTSAPNQSAAFVQFAADFDDVKSSPVDDELILSDVAFTEKGS